MQDMEARRDASESLVGGVACSMSADMAHLLLRARESILEMEMKLLKAFGLLSGFA